MITVCKFSGQPGVMASVLTLERRNFSKSDSWAGIMDKEVKRQNTTLLLAFDGEKVVGYLVSTTSQLRVHLSKVAVDKGYRRRGIAKQLIQECLDTARRERKVACAGLHVDPQNEAARKLYQGLGFKIDGVLQDYYSSGRPAWKMLKNME